MHRSADAEDECGEYSMQKKQMHEKVSMGKLSNSKGLKLEGKAWAWW